MTWQSPVPEQSPPQPTKLEPGAASACRVTWVPVANGAVHVAPQSIPAGVEVTVPDPAPDFVTVRS